MKAWLKAALLLGISATQVHAADEASRFRSLYEQEWQFRLETFPEYARGFGGEPQLALLYADASVSVWQQRLSRWRDFQRQLAAIDVRKLDRADRINYRILALQLQNQINDIANGGYLMSFNSDSQFWSDYAQDGEDRRCRQRADCEKYFADLKKLPAIFDAQIALMREGLKRGISQPHAVLKGRDAGIAKQLVRDIEQSAFYTPLRHLPAEMAADEQGELRAQARQIIRDQVLPAYRRLQKFFTSEYQRQARSSIAATALPGGDIYYQGEINEYTTLSESAARIHQIGLDEVARIRKDMQQIIDDLQFKGDFAAFLNFLRTDPRFYARTPRELLAHATYWAKKADGELPRFFRMLPRQPYGVAAVPETIAPHFTTGRYIGAVGDDKAGYYWVNTSKLDQRPLWALAALTLHEAVPGHHLQNAIAAEQGEQPPFRRYASISALSEGWALYCERLGVEMGIYETPYDHFGRLVYEMWRAARLVVDTGMHAKGWSREQAVQFMRENTALSEHEINTEIDRYISWPGQALSYKLGEIRIRELRNEAQARLGSNFDLRAFHDQLLALGSVPLSVLDEEMRVWMTTQEQAARQ